MEGKSILLETAAELQNVPRDTAASGDRFPPRDRLGVRFAAGHMLSIQLRDSSVDSITAGICIHEASKGARGAVE